MFVTHSRQSLVDSEFIREDLRTLQNAISDNWKDGFAAYIPDLASREFSAALYHSEYSRLIQSPASSDTFALSTKIGLVYFDITRKNIIGFGKHGSDLFAHAPRGLIGDTRLTLNLFGRDTAARLRHEIDDIEPSGQGGGGLMKDCASGGRKMIAAESLSRCIWSSKIF